MRAWFILASVAVLALALRAVDLAETPGWDYDEGCNLNYALNLASGRMQYFDYRHHFVPHPPAYFLVAAASMAVLPGDIPSLRLLSAALSIAGLLLVYGMARREYGALPGLLAALGFAVYPELVFWNRMGFANNLLSVLALGSMYCAQGYFRGGRLRWLAASALLAGLCPVTEYAGVGFVAALLAVVRWHEPGRLRYAIAVSLAPLAVFAGAMLAFDSGGFILDLGNYFGVYPLALPLMALAGLAWAILSNPVHRLIQYPDYAAGRPTAAVLLLPAAAAFFALEPLRAETVYGGGYSSPMMVFGVFSLFLLGRGLFRDVVAVNLGVCAAVLIALNRWDHMSIPLHHMLAVASAPAAHHAALYLRPLYESGRRLAPAALAAVFLLPYAGSLWLDLGAFFSGGLCGTDRAQVVDVCDAVNRLALDGGLVVAPTFFAPCMGADITVWENVLPYNGVRLVYWNRDYGRGEYARNLSADNIGYAVMDRGTLGDVESAGGAYAAVFGGLAGWERAYESNGTAGGGCGRSYVVLRNPLRSRD